MPPIYNTTGKDDADYQTKVRTAVMDRLKRSTPQRKTDDDGEEG